MVWLVICLVCVGCWWVWVLGLVRALWLVALRVGGFGRSSLLELRLGVCYACVYR